MNTQVYRSRKAKLPDAPILNRLNCSWIWAASSMARKTKITARARQPGSHGRDRLRSLRDLAGMFAAAASAAVNKTKALKKEAMFASSVISNRRKDADLSDRSA